MRTTGATAALLALAACGRSESEQLQDAANQSDPAAAAVLNDAAEAGVDPQNALEAAGQAQIANGVDGPAQPSGSLQAKPNLPNDPNRPTDGQPPAKISTTNTAD